MAYGIFGEHCFRLRSEEGYGKPSAPLFDGIMVAIDRLYASRNKMLEKRVTIAIELDKKLAEAKFYELVVSRANTADSTKKRIDQIEELIAGVIND